METWARVRSSAYGLMCGSLLPFSRRRGRVQALENSPKAGGTHTRTREEHPRFVRILTKRFNSLNKVVRILTTLLGDLFLSIYTFHRIL